MSETTSPPAVASAESAPAPDPSDNYDGIVKQLNEHGFGDSEPEQSPAEEPETAEPDDGEEVQTVKLKVNGKVIEKPLSEVIKSAQIAEAASQKLEVAKKEIAEARETKQQLESQQQAVRDLLGVMAKGDIDSLTEFVTDKLQAGDAWNKAIIRKALQIFEYSKMTPEQREALENRKLVEKYKREQEERTKTDEQRAHEYAVNQWQQHIATEVPKAIKEVGLADTAFVREYLISTWRAAIERGQTPTAQAVAAFVKERLAEAKMTGQPAPQPVAPQPRRKATRESVGLGKPNGQANGQGYMSWSEWQRVRGK